MADGVPEIVNETLVQMILRQYFKDDYLNLSKCDLSLVGSKGDNYSSIVTRAECQFTTNGKEIAQNVIIKCLPTAIGSLKYVKESQSFEKETKMMKEVVPSMQEILKNVGVEEKFAAELYFAQESENNFILGMEDLSVDNYSVRQRSVGLDLDESLLVMNKIASFHAASILYIKKLKRKELKFFDTTIWGKNNAENLEGMKTALETIVKQIDSWSDQKWRHKLEPLVPKITEMVFGQVGTKDENYPLVLNHGDLWLNNMMFKDNPLNLKFVDLQLSWINSPVFDVLYFIFTSPKPEIRFTEMQTMLKTYHNKFTEQCQKLGLELNYDFTDMEKDIKRNLSFGFAMFFFVYCIISAPPEDAVDTTREDLDVMKDNPIFANKVFQKNFLEGLPYFEQNGLF